MQPRKPGNALGIDVSHWQGKIDWVKVKEAGYSFAFLKASEGSSMVDSNVYDNYNGARAAGVLVGLYHFTHATTLDEARREASFFCTILDACGGIQGMDLPPVLDVEPSPPNVTTNYPEVCRVWCKVIEEKYGVKPIIYSYPYFIDAYMNDPTLASEYKLWLADYANNQPFDHAGWDTWTFLQYTNKGKVPGINAGGVDLNEFNGGVDELLAKMDAKVAQDLIAVCKAHYALSTSDADRQAWHDRAEEIRRVSGLPADE